MSPVLEGVVGKTHVTAVDLIATRSAASEVSCIALWFSLLYFWHLFRFVALPALSLFKKSCLIFKLGTSCLPCLCSLGKASILNLALWELKNTRSPYSEYLTKEKRPKEGNNNNNNNKTSLHPLLDLDWGVWNRPWLTYLQAPSSYHPHPVEPWTCASGLIGQESLSGRHIVGLLVCAGPGEGGLCSTSLMKDVCSAVLCT